jgi:hypothetical protein
MQSRLEKLKNVVEHYNQEKSLTSLIDSYAAQGETELADEDEGFENEPLNEMTNRSVLNIFNAKTSQIKSSDLDLDLLVTRHVHKDGYVES